MGERPQVFTVVHDGSADATVDTMWDGEAVRVRPSLPPEPIRRGKCGTGRSGTGAGR